MGAIPLSAIGQAAITMNVPWGNRMFRLVKLGNPLGVIPPGLRATAGKGTPIAALKVMAARGATSGGNARTRKHYESNKRHNRKVPTSTLSQIIGR